MILDRFRQSERAASRSASGSAIANASTGRTETPPSQVSPRYAVQGRTVTIPVEVRDAVAIVATFVVSAAAVRRLLPTPRLVVPELLPGRALCALAAVEYRDNDLGCYNELAVNFFVQVDGAHPTPLFGLLRGFHRREIGAYIHRLPVTTSFSRDAGRDIWGFPKTVEEITFRDQGRWRTCTLVAGGVQVLTLSVIHGGRRRFPAAPQDAYAWRDGTLFKTSSVMRGEGVGFRLGGARLTLGAHAIADELRSLGLPRRALMTTSMEHMAASFAAPVLL